MNSEQVKARAFYERLFNKGVGMTLSWVGVGILVFLTIILCLIPAQELYLDNIEESGILMSVFMTGMGSLAGFIRISPYETYTMGPNEIIPDAILLQYHPIDIKEVKKMKIFYLMRFYAKVGISGLVLQLIPAYIAYGKIEWVNFCHIFVFLFLLPVLFIVVPILFRRRA